MSIAIAIAIAIAIRIAPHRAAPPALRLHVDDRPGAGGEGDRAVRGVVAAQSGVASRGTSDR